MTQFYSKTKICYGEHAMETLERLPATKVFIVTDPFIASTGFVERLETHLSIGSIDFCVFADVEADPSLDTITTGTYAFLQSGADAIIALGGGSAIDAAKAIAYFALKADPAKGRPYLVAIPTTSGTGAEVTAIAVVTDKQNEIKIPLNDELLIPDIAILDARFTLTVPPAITAATGMDVLTHAIEAYVSREAIVFTSIYAKHAIRSVFKDLPQAYAHGDDMNARQNMLLASCMAGVAFNSSGLGITHSIAHSIGGFFHVPHGLANAILLPYVIEYNSFDAGIAYQKIAKILNLPASSVGEGVNNLVQAVRDLNSKLNIPSNFSALNIDRSEYTSHLSAIADNALQDICTAGNPRHPSHKDIIDILEKAW